jgi:CBS domain-containing protein
MGDDLNRGEHMEGKLPDDENRPVKIGEVLKTLKGREIPVVTEESSVEEAIHAIVRLPHSHLLYVVDNHKRLMGTISVANLVRHFFSRSHEPRIHPRHLISMITTETAKDIMERHPIFAMEDEEVEMVLKRMIEKNVEGIAVLDGKKRPVGDITMTDLLGFLIKTRKKQA